MTTKRYFNANSTRDVFDHLIDRHSEAYLEVYPEVKEFNSFERSGTGSYYIGMIWTRENEKPDTTQLKLRGSDSLTCNKMIELDTSAIDSQQSFFPGQIIAFLGDPFTKRQLTIRKLLDPMRIAPRLKTISTDDKINLLIASGPFMKPDQADWTLFDEIIATIMEKEATHVILIGPFVDMENKIVRANYDIFWRTYLDKLLERLVNHACQIYLVPSSRDVLPADLCATYFYPSSAIEFELRLKENIVPKCKITSVTDPSQIDLGGIYLDVTSAEVLFHLNRCSSFINKGGSTFASMYRHLLSLGIYPIYPPPNDIAVDYPELYKHINIDRLGPHILVLPTRFNTSISNVENRLIITIQKCSTKKQVVLVEIPKIDGSSEEPIDSVLLADYKSKIIDLLPAQEVDQEGTPEMPPKVEAIDSAPMAIETA